MEVTMTVAVRNMTRDTLPPFLPVYAAPAPAPLPALRARSAALLPADPGQRADALVARAVEAAGIEPFLRLARLYPTLFQGLALPIGAMLVMCLVMGGPAVLVVGAYFVGCGMILSRKAVATLLDQLPESGGQQPA
jgi:hypothetical protein